MLPREFHFAPAEPAEFWGIQKPQNCRGCHGLFGIARLKDGVTFDGAMADIAAVAKQLEKQYPDSNRDQAAFMLPLTEVIVGDIKPILLVLLWGSALLLLIASVNVASLLLVRAESRKREMAVRGALGASPRRLVRQLITEGMLLAGIGCVLGVGGALQSMRLLATLIPKDMLASMPFLRGLGLNWHVVLFGCVLAAASGGVVCVDAHGAAAPYGDSRWPGAGWTRRGGAGVAAVRRESCGGGTGHGDGAAGGRGLAGQELLSAACMSISACRLTTLRRCAWSRSRTSIRRMSNAVALAREVVQRLSALPGVQQVGLTTKLPIEDADWTTSFRIVGRPFHGEHNEVAIRMVSAGYMAALKTTLKSGRYFREDEDASKPKVIIVNEALAKQYFPGEDPVGKQMSLDDGKTAILVVGVINDIQEGQLDAKPRGAMYLPFFQKPNTGFVVLARTAQDERAMLPAIASTLQSVDGGMAIFQPMTMAEKVHDAPATYLHRSSAWLVGGFAGMALLLGVVGLYGVIAYSVSQRTREIGVRMALGAERGNVYGMVLREAGRLIAVGVGAGLLASVGAGMGLRKLLFGVSAWDAETLVVVALVLACSALAASFLPARRAALVSPADALRAE